ncbi:ribonuclease H-like [Ambystoma mexicanum]|uniref:ribonuclease H-like n=1 Tax=Ambystoma mexicanum TaxID=8296 RepID=UPI0037E87A6E
MTVPHTGGEDDDMPKANEDVLEEGEVYFVDSSTSINPETGEKHVGATVVRLEEGEYETIVQKRLPPHFSMQAAELVVLIEALNTAKGCAVTIYTDSAYMTTTVHGGLSRWGWRGFRRADGSPVQYAELLKELIDAINKPTMVALVKCQPHTNNKYGISLGNAAADAASKEAAYLGREAQGEFIIKGNVEEE